MNQNINQYMLLVNMKESKYAYVGFLALMGLIFYVMNYYTPLYCDDFNYNFVFGTSREISTLGDVLESQYIHYFQMNGRFVPHFFVQLFDGILGKDLFNVVNALMSVAFFYLIGLNLKKYFKSKYIVSSLAFFFLFFFLQGFQNCFLWMSGACNYLWVATFLLEFNLLLKREFNNKWSFVLLFIAGVICGWTNEALTVGLGAGYFIYYVYHRKQIKASNAVLLLGFYIGILMLLVSPGSWSRLPHSESDVNVLARVQMLLSAVLNMDNIRLLPILTLVLVTFKIVKRIEFFLFFKENVIEFTAVIVSFLFILMTNHAAAHSRFGFEFFSLLLILKLLSKISIRSIILTCSNIVILCILIHVMPALKNNHDDYLNCVNQIQKGRSELVLTNVLLCDDFTERFVRHFCNAGINLDNYTEFLGDAWIAKHYHKAKIRVIPKTLYEDIVRQPSKFTDWNFDKKYSVYVKKCDALSLPVKATLELEPVSESKLPFYLRPIVRWMQRYTMQEVEMRRCDVISIQGKDYLFVGKNSMVNDRVINIRMN